MNQSPLAEELPAALELVADLIGRRMIQAAVGALADHVPGLGHSSDEELAKAITGLVRALSAADGTEAQARHLGRETVASDDLRNRDGGIRTRDP